MSAQANDTIDLRAIFRKLLSKWWLFLITISISLAAGVAYIKTTPKLYHIKTVVMMSEKSKSQLGASEEFLKGSSLLNKSADIEDQIAQLTSVTNMAKTLRRL